MFRINKAILATTGLVVFSLATGVAIADQNCRQVKAKMTSLSQVFGTADGVCNGYDFCQYSDYKGFPKGRLWAYWTADRETIVFGDTFVLSADDVFESRHGEFFAQERGVVNFYSPEGYVGHLGLTGGTGRYDGATGWMSWTVAYVHDEYGWLRGEICGPYIPGGDDDSDSD